MKGAYETFRTFGWSPSGGTRGNSNWGNKGALRAVAWPRTTRLAALRPACLLGRSSALFQKAAHRTADVFGGENPMDGVPAPPEPEGEWKGLERPDIIRPRNAAMTLRKNLGRGTDTGYRDYAFYYVVEGTGLRSDEVCDLDWERHDGRRFVHARQKTGYVRRAAAITRDGRRALDEWKAEGRGKGPVFPMRRENE